MCGLDVSLWGKQSSFLSVWAHRGNVALTKSRTMWAVSLVMHCDHFLKLFKAITSKDNFLTGDGFGSDKTKARGILISGSAVFDDFALLWVYAITLSCWSQRPQSRANELLVCTERKCQEIYLLSCAEVPGTETGLCISIKRLVSNSHSEAKSVSSSVLFKNTTPVLMSMWNQEL